MLSNLLGNAVKYTSVGCRIRLALQDEKSQYPITVSDAGEGIPPEAQPHIFDRFFRVDKACSRTQSSTGSGAGLGLSIARWAAEAHGGHLVLVRSNSSGSSFQVYLPHQ
jgi:signal transduction histidine kinase